MKDFRYLAESFRIPVFVTNQVRTSSGDKALNMGFTFEGEDTFICVITIDIDTDFDFDNECCATIYNAETCQEDSEAHLTAALGTSWAHAVNIRLILESLSGEYVAFLCCIN